VKTEIVEKEVEEEFKENDNERGVFVYWPKKVHFCF
jgi:hypothetical protein